MRPVSPNRQPDSRRYPEILVSAHAPSQFRHKTRMYNVITSVQPAGEIAVMPADAGPGIWFDAIFREHYPRIVALLARLTGDRSQAEEIAADVFCKISQREPLGLT